MSSAQARCPKCAATIRAEIDETTTELVCPECGKVLKVKRKSKPAPPPPVEKSALANSHRTAEESAPAEPDALPEESAAGDPVAGDFDGGDTYRLRMPEPDLPDEDPFAEDLKSSVGDEPWSDLDDDDLSGGETLRPAAASSKSRPKKKKGWKKQAEQRREELKRHMRLWTAGAGAFVLLCVGGILILVFRGGGAGGGGPFNMGNVVGDYGKVSSGNFVKAEPLAGAGQPSGTAVDPVMWTEVAKATVEGPPGDDEAGPWQPFEVREPPETPELNPLAHVPVAWNDRHYLTVERVVLRRLDMRWHAVWRLYDLATNRPASMDVSMGSPEKKEDRPPLPILAISADSEWISGTDYVDRTRVRLWQSNGVEQSTFVPVEGVPVKWLHFTPDGRLLTLSRNVLKAWSIPEGEVAWEVQQEGPAIVIPSRHGDWLAMGHGTSIDFIDVATGNRRGRLTHDAVDGITDIAIGPHEQRLAAAYTAPFRNAKSFGRIVIWDLKDGTAREIANGGASWELLADEPHTRKLLWANENWLATHYHPPLFNAGLLYADGWTSGGFHAYLTDKNKVRSIDMHFGPFEHFWARAEGDVHPIEFVGEDEEVIQQILAHSEAQEAQKSIEAVAIEVDAGSDERSLGIAQQAAAQLRKEGIQVVEDGPTLRATFSVGAGLDTLTIGGREVNTPRVSVAWTFVDEEGNKQWTEGYGKSWKAEQSRFKKGFPQHMPNGEVIYRYEFPNNPRQDMFEEVMFNRWEIPHKAIERLKEKHGPEIPELPQEIPLGHVAAGDLEVKPDREARKLEDERIGLLAEGKPPGPMWRMTFLDDERLMAACKRDGDWWLISFNVEELTWGEPRLLTDEDDIALTPTCSHLATLGSRLGRPLITITELGKTDSPIELVEPIGERLRVRELGFSADARYVFRLATQFRQPMEIDLWDLTTGEQVLDVPAELLGEQTRQEGNAVAAFSPWAPYFVSITDQLAVWNTDDWRQRAAMPFPSTIELPYHDEPEPMILEIDAPAFSRANDLMAVVGRSVEKSGWGTAICIWRLSELQGDEAVVPETIVRNQQRIRSVRFAAGGQIVAFDSNDSRTHYVEVFSRENQQCLRHFPHEGWFAINPSGDTAVLAGWDALRIYDVSTPLTELAAQDPDVRPIPLPEGFAPSTSSPLQATTKSPAADPPPSNAEPEPDPPSTAAMRRRQLMEQRDALRKKIESGEIPE